MFKLRKNEIRSAKFKFAGTSVNWSNWRQFNSTEKNSSTRKQVFDEFIKKSAVLAPIIQKRFERITEVYEQYSNATVTPLGGYLENEKFSQSQLVSFVKTMGSRTRIAFAEALADVSQKVLGREAEYYDDYYFFRNRVFSEFDHVFAGIDPVSQAKKLLRKLGFDTSSIFFDVSNRKNKYPSPICFFVHIPYDVRVLFKSESAYFGIQGCFHETGHAMQATSVSASRPY